MTFLFRTDVLPLSPRPRSGHAQPRPGLNASRLTRPPRPPVRSPPAWPRFLRPGCSIIRFFPDGRAHGFAALANIGVLRAGRAQPLYLLTPAGRFALRATAHRADASLRCASGRFGPSAQVPTGHALPFAPAGVWGRAPKPYAAAFFVSVASVRRTQETRLFPKPGVFQRSEASKERLFFCSAGLTS